MGDISDIVDMFGHQNDYSGLQQWQANGGVAADPNFTSLAQLAPRTYKEMLPGIIQQQQEKNALSSYFGANNPAPAQQNPMATVGDTQPYAPAPQILPDPNAPAPTAMAYQPQPAPQGPSPSALAKIQALQFLPNGMQDQLYSQMALNGGQLPGMSGDTTGQPNVVQTLANKIANYQAPPMTGTASKTPVGMAIQALAEQINPDYDANIYKQRTKTAQDFTPGGAVGTKLTQVQTAINHLAAMDDASTALGGVNAGPASGALNPVNSWWNSQDPSVTDYKRYSSMAGDEIAKFVAGGNGSTEGDRANQASLLSINQSPSARHNAAQAAVQVMFGKLEPIVDQYNQAYGTQKTVADFLDKSTQDNLQKLGMLPDTVQAAPASPLAALTQGQPVPDISLSGAAPVGGMQLPQSQAVTSARPSALSQLAAMADAGGSSSAGKAKTPEMQAMQAQQAPEDTTDDQKRAQRILDMRKKAKK